MFSGEGFTKTFPIGFVQIPCVTLEASGVLKAANSPPWPCHCVAATEYRPDAFVITSVRQFRLLDNFPGHSTLNLTTLTLYNIRLEVIAKLHFHAPHAQPSMGSLIPLTASAADVHEVAAVAT